ncbi:hypothetical protein [Sphingosinicella sp.]|uniref:hypothetical protein n=1 Tax=Sphingosinicella sp. TaxID=1917971 RepID=UPI00403775E6
MYDIHVILPHEPGMLARFGEALGSAGVSLEGGGVFVMGAAGHAHFLVADGERARVAAQEAGLEVCGVREVLVRRLDQEKPGELGRIAGALGEAGVNIVTMYSDHDNRLILVVDDVASGAEVTRAWAP